MDVHTVLKDLALTLSSIKINKSDWVIKGIDIVRCDLNKYKDKIFEYHDKIDKSEDKDKDIAVVASLFALIYLKQEADNEYKSGKLTIREAYTNLCDKLKQMMLVK